MAIIQEPALNTRYGKTSGKIFPTVTCKVKFEDIEHALMQTYYNKTMFKLSRTFSNESSARRQASPQIFWMITLWRCPQTTSTASSSSKACLQG